MNAVVLGLLEREWEAQSGRGAPFAVTCRVTEVLELAYGGAVRDLPDARTPADLLTALGPAAPSPWALRVLTALSALDQPVTAPETFALTRTDPLGETDPSPGRTDPLPRRDLFAGTDPLGRTDPSPALPGPPAVPASPSPVRLTRLAGAHLLAVGAGAGLATVLGSSPVLLGTLAAVAGAWAALLVPARKPCRANGAFHDDDTQDRGADPRA